MIEFKEFGKIARLNREVVITEKLDGTNACVVVVDPLANEPHNGEQSTESRAFEVFAQSRNRVITPENDHYGFAKWVERNADNLKQLGPGYHYGEWWGNGIQRGYGLDEKRFSLFNTWRWKDTHPECCHVVPVLEICTGLAEVPSILNNLKFNGSYAAPGFMQPEGLIAFHVAANQYFKVTCEKDEKPKGSKEA